MKTETETEAVLSPSEVRRILGVCSPEGVLVGGQALAFWADHYDVPRPETLKAAVSADVDFIAGSALARKLADVLGWKSWIPTLDDATEQSGKVTHRMPDRSVKQVDFLFAVAGLTTTDVVHRAIDMKVPDVGALRVMHPIDVLDSRIQNLLLIPQKRTPAGIAQAQLAVAVVEAFIRAEIHARGEKHALKLLERVAAIASTPGAIRIFLTYGIDPLLAVPVDDFRTTAALHAKRWPQILEHVSVLREKARQLQTRGNSSPRAKKR